MSDEEKLNVKANEEEMFDLSLKKKKKKSKSVAFADEQDDAEDSEKPTGNTEDGGDGDGEDDINAMFSDMKKKKKKKKKDLSLDDVEASLEEFSISKKKKKKEKGGDDGGSDGELDQLPQSTSENPEEDWQNSDRDYTYAELLSRVFRIIREQNPELSGGRKKYTMITPMVAREGSKKTAFSNIIEICRRMNRQPEHLIAYIFAELGTQGSVDGSQRLLIKGRFQQKQIESVLRHYISEYVTCQTCKSPDTVLKKENKLFFLQCQSCGSSRAVSAIKSGFRAQTGKRSATRQ